jgi:hypothetical protein
MVTFGNWDVGYHTLILGMETPFATNSRYISHISKRCSWTLITY